MQISKGSTDRKGMNLVGQNWPFPRNRIRLLPTVIIALLSNYFEIAYTQDWQSCTGSNLFCTVGIHKNKTMKCIAKINFAPAVRLDLYFGTNSNEINGKILLKRLMMQKICKLHVLIKVRKFLHNQGSPSHLPIKQLQQNAN